MLLDFTCFFSSGAASVMCVECYMCRHVAWTQKQTDYSSEYVAIGAAGERLCLVSCCRSGGQVAHECHSPPLILSFSLQLSSPFFFLSFLSNGLQIKLAPFHQPCAPSQSLSSLWEKERVWRCCFKLFTLIFFTFFSFLSRLFVLH